MNILDLVHNIFTPKQRAISLPNIYSLVYAQLEMLTQADNVWRALIDVYLDGAEMFAVVAVNGLLYKSGLTLSAGGVTLGELIQVEVDYKPVTQSIKTTRQADGKYRWFAFPAATAVLNRSGELDSRQLFENFVARIEDGAPYPYLSFYHVGKQITLGQADYVAVDGYTLLMSGVWDDAPLANAVRQAIEAAPDYYGISIGYVYQPETKQKLQIGEGISIPVYTDGILVECSILKETDAACLMTGAYTEGVNRMNKKAKDELEKIVAGDPALEAQVAELEAHVDTVNVSTEGLIRRENEEAPVTDPPVGDPPAAEPAAPIVDAAPVEPPAPAVMEMDEVAMQALAERVAVKVSEAFTAELATFKTANEQTVNGLNEQITKLTARIVALETPMAEAVKQAIADMPRNTRTQIVYRPTTQPPAAQPEHEETSEDIAQATLANLK